MACVEGIGEQKSAGMVSVVDVDTNEEMKHFSIVPPCNHIKSEIGSALN